MRGSLSRFLSIRPTSVALTIAVLCAAPATAQQSTPAQTPDPLVFNITVVGSTPLPGSDQPIDRVPAPVQTATDRDIDRSGALDVSDFMNRRLNAVHVNEVQGNP